MSESAVERMGTLLRDRARTAERLAQAVSAGDRGAAGVHLRTLESLARAVADANAGLTRELPGAGSEAQALLGELLRLVARADEQVKVALARVGAGRLGDWLEPPVLEPQALVAELLAPAWKREEDLVVLAGNGAAAYVSALHRQGQRRVFTLDPGAPATDAASAAGSGDVQVNAHRIEDLEGACWALRYPPPRQLRVRVVGGGLAVSVEEIAAPLQRMLAALDRAVWELGAFGPFFLRAALKNLPELIRIPSIHPLRGALAGVPAVVVAAGPSLDRNLALLPRWKGRAVIIAINQTVKALRRVGVKPDLVVALDPQDISYHFEGVQPGELGALVLSGSVDRKLFAVPADQRFAFAQSLTGEGWVFELAGEQAQLTTGTTVATGALHLAAVLGCDPVISIGRDLALDGRKYYADAAADGGQLLEVVEDGLSASSLTSKLRMARSAGEEQELRRRLAAEKLELISVPGWSGTPVLTTPRFKYEMELLHALLIGLRDTRFINATEGGAHLEGMEHLTLAQALERHGGAEVDVGARLRDRAAGVDLEKRRQGMLAGLRELRGQLRRAERAAGDCRRLCRSPKHRAGARFKQARGVLERLGEALPVLTGLAQSQIRTVLDRDDAGWSSLAEVTAAESHLYGAMETAARELADGVEAALAV